MVPPLNCPAQNFDELNIDEKLSTIFSALTCNQGRLGKLERKMNSIIRITNRMQDIEAVVNSHDDRLKLIEYKSIDMEARSRRNNLLFKGIPESRDENCRQIICDFLEQRLGSDELPSFERAHRLGSRRNSARGPRPVIVAFSFYRDTETIMRSAPMLRDTPFGISTDYPLEITRARQVIWPQFKAARASNPGGRTSIGYPAKLVVNGKIVQDMFPDWNSIMKGSRVHCPGETDQTTFSANPLPAQTNTGHNNFIPPVMPPCEININESDTEIMETQKLCQTQLLPNLLSGYVNGGAANDTGHQQENAGHADATGSIAKQLDSSKNQTRPKSCESSTNTYNSKDTDHKSPDQSSSPSPTNHTCSNRGVFSDREIDSGDCSTNETTSNVIYRPSNSAPRPRTQYVGRHGHKSDLSLSPRSLANKFISSGSSASYTDTLAGTKQAPGYKEGGGHD